MPLPPPVQQPSPWADPLLQARLGTDPNDVSLVSLWHTVVRRRAVVAGVMALAFLVGLALALRHPRYMAAGSLQVRSGTSNQFRYDASGMGGMAPTDLDDRIESEVSVLESKTLYTKVAEQLHLASNPAIVGKKASATASMSDPVVQDDVLRALDKMIKVERLPKTETINITCTTKDPMLSTQIVSTLMNSYVELIFDEQFSSTQRAAKFLTSQLTDLKNQVLQDQQKLVDLQGKLGVVGFDDTHNLVISQLEDLAKAKEEADVARITAEARYRILQDERPDLVEGGPPLLSSIAQPVQGSLLQTLRSSEANLRSQYANVSEQFGPNYPETKRLKAELAESTAAVEKEQSRVLEQAKTAYEAAANNQKMTTNALADAESTAFQKRNDMVQYEILLHDYQSSRTLYEGLMSRLREAGVISGLESSEIALIDLPTLPVEPTGYGPVVLIAMSLALGAIVAFVVALLLDATDTSVHSVDELERFVGLPSFAVLPSFSAGGARRRLRRKREAAEARAPEQLIEVLKQPVSPFAEGVRLLRSSVLLGQPGHPPRTLMFTSAMPREGKSTVCANLACVLAQGGARVLLLDADLRRPSLHRCFGVQNKPGLTSVLTGAARIEECLNRFDAVPMLDLLTSGPHAPSPGQLLASEAMRSLLREAAERYDFVVVDSPPGLAISDASTLASMVDMVLLVVRDGIANRKMVRRVTLLLARVGANLPGFVFNGVRRSSVEYYEYKGRDGYYDYGQYGSAADADADAV